ncbi:hypothetical protein EUGRSUZ_I01873 [Eucalyptus grandis]|uniref:Uncharacterized protein n=2 Tax=Eucalyptus grandis TaxID=71139 RepID=A0ACC3JH08_EUCGR|nr:hypothetical protein EUGRSUZ_I01873 [Eucalyptus grandis]
MGRRPPLPLFSCGLDLANLAVASGLLGRSWDAVSQLQGQVNAEQRHLSSPSSSSSSVAFQEFQHPEYTIVAFNALPIGISHLQEQSDLVPWSEIPRFHFLCSENIPSFSLNEQRFLYLLDASTTIRPLCITFGSPLLGDNGFQRAVSQFSAWNCLLHVVHKDDCFPRLWLQPHGEPSSYVPFGAFLLCSDSSGACFRAPESVMELLLANRSSTESGRNQELRGFHYGSIIERLEGGSICKDPNSLAEDEPDSFKAGIIAQVTAVDLAQVQLSHRPWQQNVNAQMEKVSKSEEESATRIRAAARSNTSSKASDMERKIFMVHLEWYKKATASDGFGYYDSYKSKPKERDHRVVTYKETLKEYWQRVVKESEKMPQKEGAWLRQGWLYGGNTYRRMVEPLDIAEYYAKGNRNYLTEGRSKHYILLEKWLKENPQRPAPCNSVNSRREKVSSNILTEDSCFWAHVEEAVISGRLLKSGGPDLAVEREKLVEFEQYVMSLLERYAVSSEIFLEKSSYMKWWREYDEEILGKQMMGASHDSQLAQFMRNECYHQ